MQGGAISYGHLENCLSEIVGNYFEGRSMIETVRIDREDDEPEVIELAPGETSLDFLQRVYRNPRQPISQRMRAAIEALPYEAPKLSAVAVGYITGEDFASRLERALQRSNGARLIEGRVIDEDERREIAGDECRR